MGYACPVCETPQRDGEHLANHLAFTAMLRGGDHEAWLSETVPEWETVAPETLADAVVDHAPAAEYDEVFEDTTDDHEHGEAGGRGQSRGPRNTGRPTPNGQGYDETADEAVVDGVVAEARQLTAEMYGLDGDEMDGDEMDDDKTTDDATTDNATTDDATTNGDATTDDATTNDEATGESDATTDGDREATDNDS